MSLIQELTTQTMLKKSDGSDAGSTDVTNKATSGGEIGFSMMRNTINSDGKISGSDVADYLERAAELNDEVDTVPFGLETDDGEIVKVYVNAEQADAFEEKMKQLLGVEDDIEEAINTLALDFDIIDVVWPKGHDDGVDDEEDNQNPDTTPDATFDELTGADEYDDLAPAEPTYDQLA